MSDLDPKGDPIDTFTMWLDFGDQGETAISLDLTRLNAALRRLGESEHLGGMKSTPESAANEADGLPRDT